jgi:1,4-dihydroxy-2-naphthoyl-CoA hydrolase
MFDTNISIDKLNEFIPGTLMETIGIEITELNEDSLVGRMPVDERTFQPYQIVHGGAIAALAETLGSVASTMMIDMETQKCVGIEINANHLKSVSSGYVYGTCKAIHVGRRTHVWDIQIRDEDDRLTNVARLTVAVI